jgi:hypothetical protein
MDENIVNTIADSAQQQVNQSMDGSQNQDQSQQVNPAQIRKSTQQSMLKAASNATGMEFQSMEDLLSTMARMNQQIQQLQGSQQQSQPQSQQQDDGGKKRVTGNDLQDQILAMKQEMELKEKRLREKELNDNIRMAMGDRFDGDLVDYTINKVREGLVEQDGEFIVVDSKNRQRYTQDGNPMTVRDLIEEMARTNPKLLRQPPQQGGSGLRPQGGFDGAPGDGEFVPDYTKDPAAFASWASKRGLGKGTGLKGVTASVYNSTNISKKF